MANHPARIYRGIDNEDKQPVFCLRYRLPDNQEGLVIFDKAEVMGVSINVAKATDQQIIDRVKAYASGMAFITDLLNDQHWVPGEPVTEKWLSTLDIIFDGEIYLFGITEA